MPAHYSKFKCGDVFALHISHPEGNIAVTTSAGAKPGQLSGCRADVLFVGVGLLSKERPEQQKLYWRETVEATEPDLIVPVHWDNFARKLSKGLKPSALIENPRAVMDVVKREAAGRKVRVMDLRESLWIRKGRVYCP